MKIRSMLPIAIVVIAGCASQPTIVARMSANETGCDPLDINVHKLSYEPEGLTRYESYGCGVTQYYACGRVNNFIAWTGFLTDFHDDWFGNNRLGDADEMTSGGPRMRSCYRERH